MLHPRLNHTTILCVTSRNGLSSSLSLLGMHCCNGLKLRHIRLSTTAALPEGKNIEIQASSKLLSLSPSKYPLSAMPTNMLLRSLFIATVSSNKLLLIPSLHLLSFFSKPERSYLFNVDRNPVLKAILKRTLYNQFCAGETEQETRALVKQLKDLGFKGVILTYAKEMVFGHKNKSANSHATEEIIEKHAAVTHDADIETWRIGTLKTLDLISEGDILALK
jgi:hypothetical protein